MKKSSTQFLVDQVKVSFPSVNIIYPENDIGTIVINDMPFKGIKIELSSRLDINFINFDKIDYSALDTHFKPRLKYNGCRIFFNSKRLNIYLDKKFSNDNKGEFEKAMWQFRVLEFFTSQIKTLIEDILDQELQSKN